MSSKGDEKEIGGYEAPADEFNDAEDAQPISSKFAKKVVNELYERYNTLRERRSAYKDLLFFLIFVSFNLSILYLQRDATNAYAVVSTIRNTDTLIPGETEVTSTDFILEWLHGTLENHWIDAKCGDDICERPFEFAFYGRFGCRADCGTYIDQMQVTGIQVDLYYNFRHVTSSTPATTLMQDTTWNLCPTPGNSFFDIATTLADENTDFDKTYIVGCYYAADEEQTFDQLSGHSKVMIDDVPDGEWQLYIKGDQFQKVAGAVRNATGVIKYATDVKMLHVAPAVAAYELGVERQLLIEASEEMGKTKLQVVNASVYAMYDDMLEILLQENATGVINETVFTEGMASLDLTLQESLTALDYALSQNSLCQDLFEQTTNTSVAVGEYNNITGAWNCGLANGAGTVYCLDATEHLLWQSGEGTVYNQVNDMNQTSPCSCNHTVDEFCAWAADAVESHEQAIKTSLSTLRADMAAASTLLYNEIMAHLKLSSPALHYEIAAAAGKNPMVTQTVSTALAVDTLMEAYYASSPVEDAGHLSDYRLATWENPLVGTPEDFTEFNTLNTNIGVRLAEFDDELEAESEATYHYGMDKATMLSTLQSNDVNQTLYTLVSWDGGRDYYKTCNLWLREPDFVGFCMPSAVSANIAQLDGILPSEARTRCNELCVCEATCATTAAEGETPTEFCGCRSCAPDAAYGAMDQYVMAPPPSARHLLQTDETEEMYTTLLEEIRSLSAQQKALENQVIDVSSEQQRQNTEAEAHHADTSLKDTISAGFGDLQARYVSLQGQMDELLSKQDAALASTEAALAAQQRSEQLVQQLAAQTDAIARAVDRQLDEIKNALNAGRITPEEERKFKFRAQLDKLKAEKEAYLANIPCQLTPQGYLFELQEHTSIPEPAARERLVGINNRIVAGMLLYSTRYQLGNCTNTRFPQIENRCIKKQDEGVSYGVDPVFKLGTNLYDPDLNHLETMTRYYNCSELAAPTYDEANIYPYCKELYNTKLVPYGFHSIRLSEQYTKGFPVFFDINLSYERAQDFYLYVEEGHYIEESETRDVRVQLVTYNAELLTFANIKIVFNFTESGKIEIVHSIQAVRVELYVHTGDFVRAGMEVLLAIGSVVALALELLELFESKQKYGTVKAYFRSGWNYVDLVSITIQIICMVMWGLFVLVHAETFEISDKPGGRYDVYHDPDNSKANFLRLYGNCYSYLPPGEDEAVNAACDENIVRGESIKNLASMLLAMEKCGNTLSEYMTLSGINIILMIARSLKLMDFQPRLGIVTKTLALAASDILHFMVVFGVVFMGYVMMGTLVFGYKIEEFSSLKHSTITCFETLLGEIAWNLALQELTGLEYAAGWAYFWSYQILVFMILLNFLLAIIVDAYAEIKEEAHETVSVPAEVVPMLKEKWRSSLKNKYWYTNHIPEERIRRSLKVLAGRGDEESDSEESIEFDINPEKVLKVGDEDIDKETLRRVLQHCVAYAEERTDHNDDKAGAATKSGGLFGGMFGGGGAQAQQMFSALDINGAVDMLISQHGEVKPKDDDEDVDDEEDADVKELMERMQELIKGQDDLMRGQRKLEELEERLLKVMDMPPGQ